MKFKKYLQNTAIMLLILVALKNLAAALPFRLVQRLEHFYGVIIHPGQMAVHSTLSFLLGVLMLLLAYQLYKKVQLAWLIEVILLFATIVMQITRYHRLTIPIIIIEVFILAILAFTRKDFGRKSDRLTVKKSLMIIAFLLILLLLNSTVGIIIMKGHLQDIQDISDALAASVKLLVFMDRSVLTTDSVFAGIYVGSLIMINWSCIIFAAILLLKPAIYNPIITKHDREKARRLVLNYGQNPMSYLALEQDKKYFFGSRVDGLCAYTVIGDVFVVCGDMICDEKDGFVFLSEIRAFCDKNAYQILFVNVTDCFYKLYESAGFGLVKLGEDCCIKLADYHLAGGQVAKVRTAISHASKAGITVHEYKPLIAKDAKIESNIDAITEEWLQTKGGYELYFMVGGTALQDPLDRRYFYASDENGDMLGFVIFLPYKNGYLADVTRRRTNAPQGALEKTIYEAFMRFREEGVEWGNLGLSTLYNISESDKYRFTERLFSFIYEHMNRGFGFKQLHHAKEKFAPTDWIPRYLAFYPNIFTPKLAFALIRCQFKEGMSKLVLSEVSRKDEP